MNDATPKSRHDDGDTISLADHGATLYIGTSRVQRPDWMAADQWEALVAAALDHIHAMIVATRAACGDAATRATDPAQPSWYDHGVVRRLHGLEGDAVDPVAPVERAEAAARAAHAAGTCHLSEWSCSYCEQEAGR